MEIINKLEKILEKQKENKFKEIQYNIDIEMFESNLNKLAVGLAEKSANKEIMNEKLEMSEEALEYFVERFNKHSNNLKSNHIDLVSSTSDDKLIHEAIKNAKRNEAFLRKNIKIDEKSIKQFMQKSVYRIQCVDTTTAHGELELKKQLINHIELSIALLNIIEKDDAKNNITYLKEVI